MIKSINLALERTIDTLRPEKKPDAPAPKVSGSPPGKLKSVTPKLGREPTIDYKDRFYTSLRTQEHPAENKMMESIFQYITDKVETLTVLTPTNCATPTAGADSEKGISLMGGLSSKFKMSLGRDTVT